MKKYSPYTSADHPRPRAPIRKGDIRRVEPLIGLEGESRLALIVRTPISDSDLVSIALVHEQPQMAGPKDAVFHIESKDLPDGIVVQTHLRGTVWRVQLSDLVIQITHDELNRIASVMSESSSESQDKPEPPTPEASTIDHQDFRADELEALRHLTGDCLDAILDDDDPWRLDPGLLSVELLKEHEFPQHILTEVMHVLRTRLVNSTEEDLKALDESGAFLPSTWSDTPYGKAIASQIATGASVLSQLASADLCREESEDNISSNAVLAPQRHLAASSLTLHAGTRLITAPFLWKDGGTSLMQLIEEADQDTRDTHQQSPTDFEVMLLATPAPSEAEVEDDTHVN